MTYPHLHFVADKTKRFPAIDAERDWPVVPNIGDTITLNCGDDNEPLAMCRVVSREWADLTHGMDQRDTGMPYIWIGVKVLEKPCPK